MTEKKINGEQTPPPEIMALGELMRAAEAFLRTWSKPNKDKREERASIRALADLLNAADAVRMVLNLDNCEGK